MNKTGIGFFAEDVPAKLKFAGKEVTFNETIYRYAAAEVEFSPHAREAILNMEKNFASEIGSLDKFLERSGAWIYESLSDLLDFTMGQLSLNGCFAMEKHSFFEQYVAPKIKVMPQIFDKMQDVHDAIDERQDKKMRRG